MDKDRRDMYICFAMQGILAKDGAEIDINLIAELACEIADETIKKADTLLPS